MSLVTVSLAGLMVLALALPAADEEHSPWELQSASRANRAPIESRTIFFGKLPSELCSLRPRAQLAWIGTPQCSTHR